VSETVEPCWTGLSEGARCHRGGIGCPLPHMDDPGHLWRVAPRGILDWNPLAHGLEYPRGLADPVCPEHHGSTAHGNVVQCTACPAWARWRQRHALTGWTRQRRRNRRARRHFMRKLAAGPGRIVATR
jgi:hypothetical protein